MNRKLVNGLLLLTLSTVGCSTFTSCKDNEEDWHNEVAVEIADLQDLISKIKSCDCQPEVNNRLTKIETWLDMNKGANLDARVTGLITGYLDAFLPEGSAEANWPSYVNSELGILGGEIARLDKVLYGENGSADDVKEGSLVWKVNQAFDAIFDEDGNNRIELLDEKINTLQNLVNENKAQIDAILARLNAQITSIEINQTYNPIFGTLNFPIGLNTTILANYYGNSSAAFDFPFGDEGVEVGDRAALEANIAALSQLTPKNAAEGKIPAGNYMASGNDNLGVAYVTINPANVNFTGQKLALVNSQNVAAPSVVVAELENTDKVLDFGYTPSRAEGNGFYAAKVSIDAANAEDIKIDIEPGLKSAFEDALKSPSKQDLYKLSKLLLEQMDGFLTAYGFRATWETADGTVTSETDAEGNVTYTQNTTNNSIFSDYKLAATTIHPLSFEFLQGKEINHKLPTFSPLIDVLDELVDGLRQDLKFDINKEDIVIEGAKIVIDLSSIIKPEALKPGQEAKITLTYTQKGVVPDPNQPGDGALNDLINEIVDKINSQLNSINGEINTQVAKAIQDIYDRLAGKVNGADRLLSKYNALAERINKILANPNAYLQVLMAYQDAKGNLHHLSTDKNVPTVFKKGSGDGFELFVTTYTGEIIAPAYKKYVAFLDGAAPANSVNADNEMLNSVLPGYQQKVPVKAATLEAGKTYTVVYSAVDYRGKTSTRFYYITVVD